MIEPQRPIRSMASWNRFQARNELFPKPRIFTLRPLPLARLAGIRRDRKDASRRKRLQWIPKAQQVFRRRPPANADLLEEGQQSRREVIQTLPSLVFRSVVLFEFLALEAGRHPIGGRDDPLQEGVGLVVGGRRVDQRVCGINVSRIVCMDTTHKRRRVAAEEIGEVIFDQVKSKSRIRGVAVREPTALACLTHWTIEREMSIETRVLVKGAGALGELAEVV